MTGHGIHHPKTLSLFSKIFGAICQQMPATDSVVALCASELRQLACIELFHL
jgi:hypothetical protein